MSKETEIKEAVYNLGREKKIFKNFGELLKKMGYTFETTYRRSEECEILYRQSFNARERAKDILSSIIGDKTTMKDEDIFEMVLFYLERKGQRLIMKIGGNIVLNPLRDDFFKYIDNKTREMLFSCKRQAKRIMLYPNCVLSGKTKELLALPEHKNKEVMKDE